MSLTEPTSGTRAYLRRHDDLIRQMKKAQRGLTARERKRLLVLASTGPLKLTAEVGKGR